MKRTAIVGLDLSKVDKNILLFVANFSSQLQLAKIVFVHIAVDVSLPADGEANSAELNAIRKKVDDEIDHYLKNSTRQTPKYEIQIRKGNPSREIYKLSKAEHADMLILGNKTISGESGLYPSELVEKSNCSVLLVPERELKPMKNIGIAIDFSDVSKKAVAEGMMLSDSLKAEIQYCHIVTIPPDFYRTGKDIDEYKSKLEKIIYEEAEQFFNDIDPSQISNFQISFKQKSKTTEGILEFVENANIDMLIMGSKGRSAMASVLLGSIAKKVTEEFKNKPLIITKEKNKNLNLLDTFLT